ncbi:MAG: hypothetical protein ABI418_16390 [Jatrophihabitantaceae bacterium]
MFSLLLLGVCAYLASVVRRYKDREDAVWVRSFGFALQVAGMVTALAAVGVSLHATHGKCASGSGPLDVWADLMVAAIIMYSSGLLLYKQGATWAAIAALAATDGYVIAIAASRPVSDRSLGIAVLAVHAVCCIVAAWWARRLRHAEAHIRAKASEAGRVLVIGWGIVLLLLMFGQSANHAEANSQLIGLFLVTAVSAVMGKGYTAYTEALLAARQAMTRLAAAETEASNTADETRPEPDRLTYHLASIWMAAWLAGWQARAIGQAGAQSVAGSVARLGSVLSRGPRPRASHGSVDK